MNLIDKKIGVWGYGIVGKSLINYLLKKNQRLSIIEKRQFNQQEIDFFKLNNISFYNQQISLNNFLQEHDYIIASPGIDLRPYKQYESKWLTELDLFAQNFKKPIIAVTGTIGKTTTTQFLEQIFKNNGKNFIAAGNIGLGMCDLIDKQDEIDGVILEVSSFQLEHCKIFKPDISVLTNFYPNHLDRHDTIDDYFNAKSKIFINQNENDINILPWDLSDKIPKSICSKTNYFCLSKPSDIQLKQIKFNNIFFIEADHIVKMDQGFKIEQVISLNQIPKVSFMQNWIIICATLYLQKIKFNFENINFVLPEHRLEKFITINEVDFYNDSKSTIPDATLAAVSNLENKPIILFLGGISKGVDRSSMISNLKNKVKQIICFGSEAKELKTICELNSIESYEFNDLESSLSFCFKIMKPNDQVLFSPSGASFDQYSNYMERGKIFKQLVFHLKSNYEI